MLSDIQTLLRDPTVRQSVAGAASREDAIRLIVAAAAARGMPLTYEGVSQVIAGAASDKGELTDADLLNIAGGRLVMASGNCHTDTCWGSNCC